MAAVSPFGSTCVNYEDEHGYECICPLGYMGKHCDLEVITSATITTSTDFIIAIIACLAYWSCKLYWGASSTWISWISSIRACEA